MGDIVALSLFVDRRKPKRPKDPKDLGQVLLFTGARYEALITQGRGDEKASAPEGSAGISIIADHTFKIS